MNPRQVFLLDAIGASLTAFTVGVVLVYFQPFVGMPTGKLYFLAAPAVCFAIYSWRCHFKLKKRWRPFLVGIAVANLLYCIVSLGLVVYYYSELTTLGLTYFLLEMGVVFLVVGIEVRTIRAVAE